MDFIDNLRCPITLNKLRLIKENEFSKFDLSEVFGKFGHLDKGLIDMSSLYFYPIFDKIIILHQNYAVFIGKKENLKQEMSFDKKRVFDYYNEINYKIQESYNVYEDSSKWVDFRDVSTEYLSHSFRKASKFYPKMGKYLLDIASGPIGIEEYMGLSDGYDTRICIDISINALIEAKSNMKKANKKGIFICGDLTNIPLQNDFCDVVLCQHTLYHLPKNDQKTAVNEMYRVVKPKSKVVIIYSFFYHSWFMNLSLHIVQLYRIIRHFAGKLYVRLFNSKPRLYFYAHSPRWFRKSFSFGNEIEFFSWRSTNKYFLNLYIHNWFFGKRILKFLTEIEDRYSRFMGTFGEYPVIVITKI